MRFTFSNALFRNLDEPILWSVLNFVEDVLKHVLGTTEIQSRDGRIPFVTRYNKFVLNHYYRPPRSANLAFLGSIIMLS